MGRAKDPIGTRQLIMDATFRLVAATGCEGFTFEQLMQATGLSKGAIFHHVSGKNQLLVLVLDQLLANADLLVKQQLSRPAASLADLFEAFRGGEGRLLDPAGVENRILKYLLSHEEDPEVRLCLGRFWQSAIDHTRAWIEHGKRAGLVQPDIDSSRLADFCVLVNFGLRLRSGFPLPPGGFSIPDLNRLLQAQLEGLV